MAKSLSKVFQCFARAMTSILTIGVLFLAFASTGTAKSVFDAQGTKDTVVQLTSDLATDQASELRVKRRAPAASDKASLSKPMTLSQLKATLSSLKKAQVNADEQIRKIASATSMLILAAKGASATDEEKKLVLESAQTADKADEAEEEDVVAQRNIDQVLARSEKRVRLLTARSKMVLRKLQAAERSP